jgi:four helix bundle protein
MDKGKFDFEKLTAYQKAQEFYKLVRGLRFRSTLEDRIVSRQLNRAALSIALNIAEGSGRTSLRDRRNFFLVARGSCFECAAIVLAMADVSILNVESLQVLYNLILEVARMLSTMIRNLDKRISG